MKKVFVSYHFTTKNAKFNGFGNYIGEFEEEGYEDLSKFILDLQDTIGNLLTEKLNTEVQVKVLYFR